MNSCKDIGRCRQGSNDSARCCQLRTDNSDGSSAGDEADELLDDTSLLILQGLALVAFVVSAVLYASVLL